MKQELQGKAGLEEVEGLKSFDFGMWFKKLEADIDTKLNKDELPPFAQDIIN